MKNPPEKIAFRKGAPIGPNALLRLANAPSLEKRLIDRLTIGFKAL
jgi:hypothetical protein